MELQDKNQAIELALNRPIDELYADLVELDETNPLRSSNTSIKELTRAGRQKFDEVREKITVAICTSTFFEIIKKETDEKELVLIVMDHLSGLIKDTGIPIITTSVIVVRIGLNRLCRNISPHT